MASSSSKEKEESPLKFTADPDLYSSYQAIPLAHPFLRWNARRLFSPIIEFTFPDTTAATTASTLPPQVFGDQLLLRSLKRLPVEQVTNAATEFIVGRVPGQDHRRLVSLLELAAKLGLESDRDYRGFESTFEHYKSKNLQEARLAFNLRRVVDSDDAPPVEERDFIVMPLWEYEEASRLYRAVHPEAPLPSPDEIYRHDESVSSHALNEMIRLKRDDPYGRVCFSLLFNADMLVFEFAPEELGGGLRFKTCTNPAFRINRYIRSAMNSIIEGLCDALEGKRTDIILNYDSASGQVSTTEELIRVLLPPAYNTLTLEEQLAAAKCKPEVFLPPDDPTSMMVPKHDYEMVKAQALEQK